MTPKGWLYVTAIGIVLAIVGGLMGWVIVPPVVNQQIGKQLALVEHSEAWYRFVDLPIALSMELRIFNVTNREGIYKGELPRFQEVGPYVYKQHRTKFKVAPKTKDDTVSYYQRLIHEFDEEASGYLREDDVVTVINPALMGMLGVMTNIPALAKSTAFIDLAAPLLFNTKDVFLTTTAGALLFRGVRIPCGSVTSGSHDRAAAAFALTSGQLRGPNAARLATLITCSSMKRIKVPTITELPNGDLSFSLFGYKNYTPDGYYTVRSGVEDPTQLGQITAWEGKPFVSAWSAPTCNAINGTQGDIFSPYVTRNTVIQVFSTDVCRSMTIRYQKDSSYQGIFAYRFYAGADNLMDVYGDPNNYCFCPQVAKGLTVENACLRKGALDLSGCQGIPVIITFPHFLDADPYYLNAVEGLDPKEELHRMVVDIEPMTGTPLFGGKRMQLNFEMKEVEGVAMTKGLRDTLMPVAWMYEGVALNDEMLDLLNGMLFNILKAVEGIKYGLIALGGLMFLVGTVQYSRVSRALKMKQGEAEDKDQEGGSAVYTNGEATMRLSAPGASAPTGESQARLYPTVSHRLSEVEGYSKYS